MTKQDVNNCEMVLYSELYTMRKHENDENNNGVVKLHHGVHHGCIITCNEMW